MKSLIKTFSARLRATVGTTAAVLGIVTFFILMKWPLVLIVPYASLCVIVLVVFLFAGHVKSLEGQISSLKKDVRDLKFSQLDDSSSSAVSKSKVIGVSNSVLRQRIRELRPAARGLLYFMRISGFRAIAVDPIRESLYHTLLQNGIFEQFHDENGKLSMGITDEFWDILEPSIEWKVLLTQEDFDTLQKYFPIDRAKPSH